GAKGGCTGRRFVSARFAPWAVLLQQNQSHLRTVGAPAPGAKGGLHGAWIVPDPFAPRRCSYSKTNPTPTRRRTRPGCEGVRPGGGLAVAFGVVGLPAPGVGAHGFEAEFGAPAEFFGGEGGVGVAAGDVAGAAVGEDVGKFVAAGFLEGMQHI